MKGSKIVGKGIIIADKDNSKGDKED